MPECLHDLPRYIRQLGYNEWQGADHPGGPWRPIPAPQAGLPWLTDVPAVPESREPASVAANPTPQTTDKYGRTVAEVFRGGGGMSPHWFSVSFGALSPPIDEQLRGRGLRLDMDPLQRDHLQRDADEVTRLRVRCILTEAESDKARQRIMRIIKKQAKPL